MEKQFAKLGISVPEILLPNKDVAIGKWAVVACDQYTAERKYWQDVDALVGDAPSTLRIIFPEVYLEDSDDKQRIQNIKTTIQQYMQENILQNQGNGFIYVERQIGTKTRKGLVMAVDLEHYDYHKGSHSLIRPTEDTIEDRLPPRMRIREGAQVELPHIMLLIDDEAKQVIEPLTAKKAALPKLYDFELMKNGGHITGYKVADILSLQGILQGLTALCDTAGFQKRYDVSVSDVLLYAVGDGNHSLATAKACWEKIKKTLAQGEIHPARYALVELVNLHDEALVFEPIHRVLFGVNVEGALTEFVQIAKEQGLSAQVLDKATGTGHEIDIRLQGRQAVLHIDNPTANLPVGTLQNILDEYIRRNGCVIDYIHGADVVESLSKQDGNIGFLLPSMDKNDLFKTVLVDGALPRKTFSMGEAHEKRYYLEARKIVK